MAPQIMISSDEVNALVHSYLVDSGFTHSAFMLSSEANLKRSLYFGKHINRGELVELLVKALLYIEAECHFQGTRTNNQCKSSFTLLDKHVCSPNPPPPSSHVVIRESDDRSPSETPRQSPAVVINAVLASQAMQSDTQPQPIPIPPSSNVAKTESESLSRALYSAMDVDQPTASSSKLSEPTQQSSKPSNKPKPKRVAAKQIDKTPPDAVVTLNPPHTGEVFVVGWHPRQRNLFVTGTKDAQVKLWTVPSSIADAQPPVTIQLLLQNNSAGDLTSFCWNSEGTLLAIGAYDSILRIYEKSGILHWQSTMHKGPIFSVKFAPSGDQLLTASLDHSVCLWAVDQQRLLQKHASHQNSVLDVEWLDNDTFASCGADGITYVYRVGTPRPIKVLGPQSDSEISLIRRSPQGSQLGACSDDGVLYIWNVDIGTLDSATRGADSLEPAVTLRGHRSAISCFQWHPNPQFGPHQLVITSAFDGTARVWDSVTGEVIKTFSDHKRPIYALTISPDGRWFATAAGDGYLFIYSCVTYEKLWSWYSDKEKPGIFEAEWQVDETGQVRWLGLALECRRTVVIDVTKLPQLR